MSESRRFTGALRALLPTRADYGQIGRSWRPDLVAGLTVGIVALPLALAFGVSSGAGAESGLITAIVAGLIAAVFGGSNVQVSGPTGAMVVVLGPVVAVHGAEVIPLLSLMAGVIVVAAGVLRLGRTVSYIPWPVIEGFTLGIAVIIFLQQVPSALGSVPGPSSNALVAAAQSVPEATWSGALWALGAVLAVAAIMLLAPRLHPQLPGSLIGIAAVTVAAVLLDAPLARIGTLPSSLPAPSLPAASPELLLTLLGPALTIAALAAIESLLSARVAASLTPVGGYHADRELFGQGLASIGSGLFGGMPATGAIARTAVNIRAGAQTRVSAIVHAVVLLLVVLFASRIVAEIPLAALAGVLMVTAFRMISIATVRAVTGANRSAAIVFALTAVVTVSFDLIIAVLIGIAVAALFALRSLAASGGVHREEIPGPRSPEDARIALFRFDGALFFGSADRTLEAVAAVQGVDVVILRMSQLQLLDATGAHVTAEMIQALERSGITVLLKGIQPKHLRLATRVGVLAELRDQQHLFEDLGEAVRHARDHVRRAGGEAIRPEPRAG
ncbi:SulP family inorganic anion transporter [Leucobacter sp. M11]|uniref:SulP family inorganic anion transporter n=1 Tax=Leucobacter sp. M11 TaxID=2993565 RepID=UPI002D7F585C|nr:SulP family inorganic anion transporter [Leucobacter sp. M11]MEB4614052.1 SulP family inorganic anion transporter [Leucobacter sp. M11]